MCLIIAKPKGVEAPSEEQMTTWWAGHPDGFGLAYATTKNVRILKGAMAKLAMFELIGKMDKALSPTKTRDVDVIYHFRQATTGAIVPSNCHPFPLSKQQSKLGAVDVKTQCAVAHNGIIWGKSPAQAYDYSESYYYPPAGEKTDTQSFIEDYLVDLGGSLMLPAVQRLIEAYTESRFALLTLEGIIYIGEFHEENGYYYSNTGYKESQQVSVASVLEDFPQPPYFEDIVGSYIPQCTVCEEPSDMLFCIPNDGSPVCLECFTLFVGRKPNMNDRW